MGWDGGRHRRRHSSAAIKRLERLKLRGHAGVARPRSLAKLTAALIPRHAGVCAGPSIRLRPPPPARPGVSAHLLQQAAHGGQALVVVVALLAGHQVGHQVRREQRLGQRAQPQQQQVGDLRGGGARRGGAAGCMGGQRWARAGAVEQGSLPLLASRRPSGERAALPQAPTAPTRCGSLSRHDLERSGRRAVSYRWRSASSARCCLAPCGGVVNRRGVVRPRSASQRRQSCSTTGGWPAAASSCAHEAVEGRAQQRLEGRAERADGGRAARSAGAGPPLHWFAVRGRVDRKSGKRGCQQQWTLRLRARGGEGGAAGAADTPGAAARARTRPPSALRAPQAPSPTHTHAAGAAGEWGGRPGGRFAGEATLTTACCRLGASGGAAPPSPIHGPHKPGQRAAGRASAVVTPATQQLAFRLAPKAPCVAPAPCCMLQVPASRSPGRATVRRQSPSSRAAPLLPRRKGRPSRLRRETWGKMWKWNGGGAARPSDLGLGHFGNNPGMHGRARPSRAPRAYSPCNALAEPCKAAAARRACGRVGSRQRRRASPPPAGRRKAALAWPLTHAQASLSVPPAAQLGRLPGGGEPMVRHAWLAAFDRFERADVARLEPTSIAQQRPAAAPHPAQLRAATPPRAEAVVPVGAWGSAAAGTLPAWSSGGPVHRGGRRSLRIGKEGNEAVEGGCRRWLREGAMFLLHTDRGGAVGVDSWRLQGCRPAQRGCLRGLLDRAGGGVVDTCALAATTSSSAQYRARTHAGRAVCELQVQRASGAGLEPRTWPVAAHASAGAYPAADAARAGGVLTGPPPGARIARPGS